LKTHPPNSSLRQRCHEHFERIELLFSLTGAGTALRMLRARSGGFATTKGSEVDEHGIAHAVRAPSEQAAIHDEQIRDR